MSSIFNRIFQYRQREHRTPSEDYFTETFVAVIEKYDELRRAFAAWLINGEEGLDLQSVRMQTQRGFIVGDSGVGRRPDIWIEATDADDARHWIIVENKIDSGEGEDQLTDYAKILAEASDLESRTLVYITKYSFETDFCENDTVNFKHRRWSEVYRFLKEELQGDNDNRELAFELLSLMEDWNMDGTLSAAHLREAVAFCNSEVWGKLRILEDEAIASSEIMVVLRNKMNRTQWITDPIQYPLQRWIQKIPGYGICLWVGVRVDRRDEDWEVQRIELPSPFVAVYPDGEDSEVGERLERPTERWTGPKSWGGSKWIRQPAESEIPRMGGPLDEFYKNFFRDAFEELKQALEGIG